MRVFNLNRKRLLSRGEKGQSLVESVLGFVVLMMLVSGLIDLGRAYFVYAALEDAAGEGALFLSIHPSCQGSGDCADPNNADWRIRNAGGGLVDLRNPSRATIIYDYSDDDNDNIYEVGETVYVEIQYQFRLLSPAIPEIAGTPTLTLAVSATQMIVGE